jgi:C-terminal processing protease CtpA/Prc
MAVLIDSNTASGGELVAAALGENKRAILLGEKTYGKGSHQTVIPIPGRGAIKLTTSYFISPNGNQINQNGVMPDIEVSAKDTHPQNAEKSKEVSHGEDSLIQRAMDLLHGLSALNENGRE